MKSFLKKKELSRQLKVDQFPLQHLQNKHETLQSLPEKFFEIPSFSNMFFFLPTSDFLNKHNFLASRNLLYAEPAEPEFHNYA